MKLTILIGCYNEKQTILKAIEEAKALKIDKEILVIDNCSTDGTREILEGLKDDKDLKIIFHSKNMGGGYSFRESMKLAQGEYLYPPGSDLEYTMEDVNTMLDKMEKENLDVVFGSRLTNRKNVSIFSLIKERPYWLGTIISTFLINLLYRQKLTDIIGVPVVKSSVAKAFKCNDNDVAFTFKFISTLFKNKNKIGEVPIRYKPRTHKEGKTIKALDMLPAIWAIFRVKFFGR